MPQLISSQTKLVYIVVRLHNIDFDYLLTYLVNLISKLQMTETKTANIKRFECDGKHSRLKAFPGVAQWTDSYRTEKIFTPVCSPFVGSALTKGRAICAGNDANKRRKYSCGQILRAFKKFYLWKRVS